METCGSGAYAERGFALDFTTFGRLAFRYQAMKSWRELLRQEFNFSCVCLLVLLLSIILRVVYDLLKGNPL
jgi:hypothetical protein